MSLTSWRITELLPRRSCMMDSDEFWDTTGSLFCSGLTGTIAGRELESSTTRSIERCPELTRVNRGATTKKRVVTFG